MNYVPTFHASFDAFDRHGCIVVLDRDEGRTVTNDAVMVVAFLRSAGFALDAMPVIYQHAEGRWDGMEVRNGAFAGFYPLGGTMKQAAQRARARRAEGAPPAPKPKAPPPRRSGRPTQAEAIRWRIAKLGLHRAPRTGA